MVTLLLIQQHSYVLYVTLHVTHVLQPVQHVPVVMLPNKENLMEEPTVSALMATMRIQLSYARVVIVHVQHVLMEHHVLLVSLHKIQQKMQFLGYVIVRIPVYGTH